VEQAEKVAQMRRDLLQREIKEFEKSQIEPNVLGQKPVKSEML
jgi:hypothetical protein